MTRRKSGLTPSLLRSRPDEFFLLWIIGTRTISTRLQVSPLRPTTSSSILRLIAWIITTTPTGARKRTSQIILIKIFNYDFKRDFRG
ncbi:hypothetical protein EVA_08114 [gut metagenome]|uniref:Uncharacterized protein n=1 Tax=gut metagenome TaxID=749906 RepID=J9GTS5_9ZZZZ